MRIMPSAANLVAAICLAALGYAVSFLIPPLLPEGTGMGWFFEVNALLGFAVGWVTVGTRTGRGWVPGINAGITGVVLLVFWGLFVQSCNEMTRQAMRNRFDSAFEALAAIFEIGVEWGMLMFTVPIISLLVVGGIVTGLLAEYAARTWR